MNESLEGTTRIYVINSKYITNVSYLLLWSNKYECIYVAEDI